MNKQEKALEILKGLELTTGNSNILKEPLQLAISALTQQLNNGWIPVSERLPDKGGYYLVGTQYETPRAMVGFYYTERNEWNYWMSQLPIMSVTAWQPLPEPYKEV
jgi:hypothetical protein